MYPYYRSYEIEIPLRCPGTAVAGAFGFWGMAATDWGLAEATIAGTIFPPSEIILIPLDILAIGTTLGFVGMMVESYDHACTDIEFHWGWPFLR
jgi:hypothetical protein